MVKTVPAVRETQFRPLAREDPLEKGMTTHSSVLALRIPWIEEPGGLEFVGSQRVRHNWATNSIILYQTHTYIHTRFSAVTTVLPKCMPLASLITISLSTGLPWWLSWYRICLQCGKSQEPGFNPWFGKIPWRRKWLPTPVLWPGSQRVRHN